MDITLNGHDPSLQSMQDADVGIAYVSIDDGSGVDTVENTVVFMNGLTLPITHMTDAAGNVVDNWDDCHEFHFGDPSHGYGSSYKAFLLFDQGTKH